MLFIVELARQELSARQEPSDAHQIQFDNMLQWLVETKLTDAILKYHYKSDSMRVNITLSIVTNIIWPQYKCLPIGYPDLLKETVDSKIISETLTHFFNAAKFADTILGDGYAGKIAKITLERFEDLIKVPAVRDFFNKNRNTDTVKNYYQIMLAVYISRKMKQLRDCKGDIKEDSKLTTARDLLKKVDSIDSTSMPEQNWTITKAERSVMDEGLFGSHRLRKIVDALHPHPEPSCPSTSRLADSFLRYLSNSDCSSPQPPKA